MQKNGKTAYEAYFNGYTAGCTPAKNLSAAAASPVPHLRDRIAVIKEYPEAMLEDQE